MIININVREKENENLFGDKFTIKFVDIGQKYKNLYEIQTHTDYIHIYLTILDTTVVTFVNKFCMS